jgi:energy-coupling factor transporter ATP-binding protein EcfA2
MKITAIHIQGMGPLSDTPISLVNDWAEEVENKMLFTGPNGCGKSTLLRVVAMLWDAAGHWLDRRQLLPANHSSKQWLERWGGIAVIFDGIQPFYDKPIGLFFGDVNFWVHMVRDTMPGITWMGEQKSAEPSIMDDILFLPNDKDSHG